MKRYMHEFLTGVISPIGWDRNEEISSYSMFTEQDEDILLRGKSVEKNFWRFKNQHVKVFGHFISPINGARVFEVTRTNLEK